MSIKLKALHSLALMAGVQFVYTCKFHSADLTRKSVGQTLWQTLDVVEAIRRWKQTTGEHHGSNPWGEGQLKLVLEASLGQAGRTEIKDKDHSHDFWPEAINSGIPKELSVAEADRPSDSA
jgi:hypothetical protein